MRCLARCLAIGALLIVACGQQPPPKPVQREWLRLSTGTPGGGFYPLGRSLATVLGVHNGESTGSVSNVVALQQGSADLALAYADVAYFAFAGTLRGQPGPLDRIRGVAVLQRAPVHLVVRAGADIRTAADLRGRAVGVGTPGSGTALTAGLVMTAFGIDPRSVDTRQLRYDEAARQLVRGNLDAMFVIGADPVDAVRVATNAGARIVPLDGAPIDKLRREYPFFRVALIRAREYPGHDDAVRTIGVENLLLCRNDLDEAVVHDLAGRLFAAAPAIPALRTMDLEQASAVPIPLHDGAARFYRERELFR